MEGSSTFPGADHDHGRCRAHILSAAETICQRRGGRLTPNRLAVLRILSASHQSLGAYDILERMESGGGRRPAPAAVYRALEFLMEMGLVHRLGANSAYFACTQPGHEEGVQFWFCRDCGAVGETESPEIAATIPGLAQGLGFRLETVNVEIEGICRSCREPRN